MHLIFDLFGGFSLVGGLSWDTVTSREVEIKFAVGLTLTILTCLWGIPNFVVREENMIDRAKGLAHVVSGFLIFWWSLHILKDNIRTLPTDDLTDLAKFGVALLLIPAIWLGSEVGDDAGMWNRIKGGALVLVAFSLFYLGAILLNEVGAVSLPDF